MRRVLHISDPHFGRSSPHLLEPLISLAGACKPDLTVVSGDLTQRARNRQFREAAAFLKRLPAPVLTVPGNHDVPLDNLFLRFFAPWHRYRRHISPDLEPVFEDSELIVAGVNTVNPWVWQQGRLGDTAVARLERLFANAGRRTCIAVMHHPLETLPAWQKTPIRIGRSGLGRLAAAGTDLVLCGHIHLAHVAPITAGPGILTILAGTGLSDRLRGAENSVHLLEMDEGRIAVETFAADEWQVFHRISRRFFRIGEKGWSAEPD